MSDSGVRAETTTGATGPVGPSTRGHIQECIECTSEVLQLARLLAHGWGALRAGGASEFVRVTRLLDELTAAVVRADARDAALDSLLTLALFETSSEPGIGPGMGTDEHEEPTLIEPVYADVLCVACGKPYPFVDLTVGSRGGPVCLRCHAQLEELVESARAADTVTGEATP